jgi:hypothetical protein
LVLFRGFVWPWLLIAFHKSLLRRLVSERTSDTRHLTSRVHGESVSVRVQ